MTSTPERAASALAPKTPGDSRMPPPVDLQAVADHLAAAPHNDRIAFLEKLLGPAACRQVGLLPVPARLEAVRRHPRVQRGTLARRPREAGPGRADAEGTGAGQRQKHRRHARHPGEVAARLRQRAGVPPTREHGQGGGPPRRLQALHRRLRDRAGRRLGVRPGRVPEAHPADPRRPGRRGLRQPVHRRAAPSVVLLALAGEPRPHRSCRTSSPT